MKPGLVRNGQAILDIELAEQICTDWRSVLLRGAIPSRGRKTSNPSRALSRGANYEPPDPEFAVRIDRLPPFRRLAIIPVFASGLPSRRRSREDPRSTMNLNMLGWILACSPRFPWLKRLDITAKIAEIDCRHLVKDSLP